MSGPALVRQPIRKRFLTTSPCTRAFPEKTESRDSPAGTNRIQGSCWNGGQHGWRNRIRKICARVVGAGQDGATIPETAEQLGVSISSVVRFRRLHRETGSVSPAKFGGYK